MLLLIGFRDGREWGGEGVNFQWLWYRMCPFSIDHAFWCMVSRETIHLKSTTTVDNGKPWSIRQLKCRKDVLFSQSHRAQMTSFEFSTAMTKRSSVLLCSLKTKWRHAVLYRRFSNSLIIHEPSVRSDCWVWVMCIVFNAQ